MTASRESEIRTTNNERRRKASCVIIINLIYLVVCTDIRKRQRILQAEAILPFAITTVQQLLLPDLLLLLLLLSVVTVAPHTSRDGRIASSSPVSSSPLHIYALGRSRSTFGSLASPSPFSLPRLLPLCVAASALCERATACAVAARELHVAVQECSSLARRDHLRSAAAKHFRFVPRKRAAHGHRCFRARPATPLATSGSNARTGSKR